MHNRDKQQKSDATSELSPPLNRGTLRFVDPELEAEYTTYFAHGSVALVRMGLVLALILYLSFGAVDLAVLGDQYLSIWLIRGIAALICLLGFAYSYLPGFTQQLQPVMAGLAALLAGGILLMLWLTGVPVINTYYVGLILVCIATHTLLRLSFVNSVLLCWGVVAGYLAVELSVKGNPGYQIFANSSFLFAAALISCVGNYAAAYQHRLNFFQQRIIQRAREESLHRALHDDLTGIGNRSMLAERAEQAFARSKRQQKSVALLFLDLDGFKELNDRWGHRAGDQVLKSVAKILSNVARETDAVARLGGDEFVILMENLDSAIEAQLLAKRIIDLFDTALQLTDGGDIKLDMSIGIAIYPEHGKDLAALLHCADLAMYDAKQQPGAHWSLYRTGAKKPPTLKQVL